MKRILKSIILGMVLCTGVTVPLFSQAVKYSADPLTGGLSRLWIDGDKRDMKWIVEADSSQYEWIGEKYHWGLGYFDQEKEGAVSHHEWLHPSSVSKDGAKVSYQEGDILVSVSRRPSGKDIVEEYSFTNKGDKALRLLKTGIYTPFNDNYPNTQTCLSSRTHAHIWAGGEAAYINAVPMSSKTPCMGLALIEGSVTGYDIWERDRRRGSSDIRGIIALGLSPIDLAPGETYKVSWRLFSNNGWDDFFGKIVKGGGIHVKVDKYVLQKGEKALVEVFGTEKTLRQCKISANGAPLSISGSQGRRQAEFTASDPGEIRFEVSYGEGKTTWAECLVQSSFENIIQKRVDFILSHQQMRWSPDPRFGAYMVYDNETEKLYLNDTPNCSPVDRTEGAERLGMGVALAKHCTLHPDQRLQRSLNLYYSFVRRGLQDENYNTWRLMSRTSDDRGYNYPFMADYYFAMFNLTGDKRYAKDGYLSLKALYRNFGHGFYCIRISPSKFLDCLKRAGMEEEYNSLRDDFIETGDIFVKNSINYPPFEVNYEQSIVSPAVSYLLDLYLATGIEKYLDEGKRQLPLLEAFAGQQPSYHLNDISIRHWDGYWFGKREMWGDVFPHYWSNGSAWAFHLYSLCTQDQSYQKRAENIVRNNMCQFFEDGRASCAYIYPRMVDGVDGEFYDPYANDQDWALVYYYDILFEKP